MNILRGEILQSMHVKILYMIRSSQSGGYEELRLLGYDVL
jgi:hypothetical protein